MKVKKQVTGYVETSIEVTDISILSANEYKTAEKNIPLVNGWWWLRSPGDGAHSAVCVRPSGDICDCGCHDIGGVRPAIRINPKYVDLQIGDKVQLEGCTLTYISEGILLCDYIMIKMPFRKDWDAKDANCYEASDIAAYLAKRFRRVPRIPYRMETNRKEWILVYTYSTWHPVKTKTRIGTRIGKKTGTKEEIKAFIESSLCGNVEYDWTDDEYIEAHVSTSDGYSEGRIKATRVDAIYPCDESFTD